MMMMVGDIDDDDDAGQVPNANAESIVVGRGDACDVVMTSRYMTRGATPATTMVKGDKEMAVVGHSKAHNKGRTGERARDTLEVTQRGW